MRRIFGMTCLCLATGVVSSCSPDEVIVTENIPTAGVRFINAVPDSAGAFGMDMRFIDIVESNMQFRVTFRNGPATSAGVTASSQTQYKNARAGQRRFAIFLDDTIQSIASVKLKDTTVTLESGKLYTAILWGNARGGAPAMKLTFYEEAITDPGAQVALRVINATGSAIDVRQYPQGGTAPAAATWANVPALGISNFVNAPTGNIMYNVQPAGGGANLFADQLAIQGVAKTVDIGGIPGTTQAGSAVTLVVYPRSTAGARTPQTAAFLVPAGAFMWDRRANNSNP